MKKIAILGSTGSIGISTLKVVQKLKPAFKVTGLTAYRNAKDLAKQIKLFKPKMAAIMDWKFFPELKALTRGTSTQILAGKKAWWRWRPNRERTWCFRPSWARRD